MTIEDGFACIEDVVSSECLLYTGLLYRGCPLIRVCNIKTKSTGIIKVEQEASRPDSSAV